jgi:DNA (cytosine-5)-methyltransferase 1
LFAGGGGFSVGFERAGFEITNAVEHDPMIARTYAANHKRVGLLVDDIANADNSGLFDRGCADIIIGGPPCQGFSMSGERIRQGFRESFTEDPRNYLFKHYFNIVKRVKPRVFIMENVKGIQTMQGGRIFEEILSLFRSLSYNVQHTLINAYDYGVPQTRERTIIVGALDMDFDLQKAITRTKNRILEDNPDFFQRRNVWETISSLENIPTDEETVPNHIATKHNRVATVRMSQVSNGENFTILNEVINSVHSGSYGRLEKDKPAPTITSRFDTPSGGKYTHPTLNRTLTPREAARIQSFSDDFIFYGNKTSICKQIGNAVPPNVSYFLAEMAKEILK